MSTRPNLPSLRSRLAPSDVQFRTSQVDAGQVLGWELGSRAQLPEFRGYSFSQN